MAPLLAALALTLATPGLTLAATQGGCLSTDTTKVLVYEDANWSGDALWLCDSNPDLGNVSHTLEGWCNGRWWGIADNWNDCISSAKIWLPAGWCMAFHQHANYQTDGGGSYGVWVGPWSGVAVNLQGSTNDAVSSVLFGDTRITNCLDPY